MSAVGLPSLRVSALAACLAVACGLAVAGCSTTRTTKGEATGAVVASGGTMSIYVSPPLGGAGGQAAADVLDAEKLAFDASDRRAGPYNLALATASGSEVSAQARDAVSNTKTIAYLGEIEPGQSGVSAQITNELDILQVSPTDTAAYLTQAVPGVKDSPIHFAPDHKNYGQTFSLLAPNSAVEAKAIVARMKATGVSSVAIADDGSQYGTTIADEVRADAPGAGLTVSSGGSGASALFYGATPSATATHALDAAAAQSSSVKLFAPSGLYDDTFVAGLSAAAQKALTVSAPGIASSALDTTGQAFVAKFRSTYGHAPAPQAIFGYEAMQAVIATLQGAGTQAAVRKTVVSDFRSLKRTGSVLGSYSMSDGNSSVTSIVFARVSAGTLVPRAAG